MKKSFIAIGTVAIFMFASCTDNKAEETPNSTETEVHDHDHDHDVDNHDHGETSETLKLNDGAKWEINEEMKPPILETKEILTQYLADSSSDYKELAEKLKKKNSELIKSCTMKGESHDELHKWLNPHTFLLEDLSAAETKEDADEIVSEINDSFKTFEEYFQL